VQDLRELADGISQHNSKLLQVLDESSRFEGEGPHVADFLLVLEELKQKLTVLSERGSTLVAVNDNRILPGTHSRDYDTIIGDIMKLLKSLVKAARDNQKALRRVALSQDFRMIDPATVESPWQQAQAILVEETDTTQPALDNGTLRVQATVKPRCNETCKCRCHEVTTAQTPRIFSRALGRLILSYNSIRVWNSRACNHPKCLKNSQTSVHLNYLFPSWMPRLALAISASWDSVVGSGASLYLSVPRVVPEHSEIFKAINTNNFSRIQWLFSNRMFLPSGY
jgi:hypothetical protein